MVAGMVAALMLIDTPKSNESVIYLIAGQLIGAFATAAAYWLGSSRGSVNKQRTGGSAVTTLSIRTFSGEVPRLPADRLPDGCAQFAQNCDFITHGELRLTLGWGRTI